LVKRALMRHPADHFNLRTYLDNCLIVVRHIFKALARAD
jgi:hypothetical protein